MTYKILFPLLLIACGQPAPVQGPPGSAGSKGATGDTGPAGAMGTNGSNGSPGADGLKITKQWQYHVGVSYAAGPEIADEFVVTYSVRLGDVRLTQFTDGSSFVAVHG